MTSDLFAPDELWPDDLPPMALTDGLVDAVKKALSADIDGKSSVCESLHAHPVFSRISNYHLRKGDGGEGPTIEDVADWLLETAKKSNDVLPAVQRLCDFFFTNSACAYVAFAVIGIQPQTKVSLTDDIEIMPFHMLPDANEKRVWIDYWNAAHYGLPDAGLIMKFNIKPALCTHESGIGYPPEYYVKLKDVLRCLTLVGPSSPIAVCRWYGYLDELPFRRTGWIMAHEIAEINPWVSRGVYPFEGDAARNVIAKYLTLDDKMRGRFRLPIDRLRLAIRRTTPEDSAIDLAIALESSLINENDSNYKRSNKMQERASYFLSHVNNNKSLIKNLISVIYDFRSTAAHGGTIEWDLNEGKNPWPQLRDGNNICAQILVKAIVEGGLPSDWNNYIINNGAN